MNLVKLQEDLKNLPTQALQQYVNGSNPEVPPYLAAAEMQRRQATMQRAAQGQGAAQGPQPSVKEQLEQSLGLGALQAQQQQQGMQQMAQQASQQPMPAPPGIAQPEAQPQAPMGMAQGGVAGLPMDDRMFSYADGGIIGFQVGGGVDAKRQRLEQQLRRARETLAREGRMQPGVARQLEGEIKRIQAELARVGPPPESDMGREMSKLRGAGPMLGGITNDPPAQARSQASQMPRRAAPPQAAKQGIAALPTGPAAPAAPQVPSMEQTAQGILRGAMGPVEDATPQQGIADETAMAQAYGLDKPQFQRTRGAMDATTADYEARKQSRDLETLMATLAGSARGYGGETAGYLDAKRAQRGQDDAYRKQMMDLERGIEGDELGLATDRYKGAGGSYKERQAMQREREKSRTGVATEITTQDAQRRENETERKFQERMKALDRANARATAGMRASGGGGEGGLTKAQKVTLDRLESKQKALQTRLKDARYAERPAIQAEIAALDRMIDQLIGFAPAEAPAPASTKATAATKSTSGFKLVGSTPSP